MRRARGVALIIALVVVALATVLATRIGAQAALGQRRGVALLTQEQAFEVSLGAEAWATEILREAMAASPRDTLDQLWAQCLPPIPVEDGVISGCIEDMQGRFNINNLVKIDGTKNPVAFDQFTRLLEAVGLEPRWASAALDWIDGDTTVDGVDGAEDSTYLSQVPPYRTANHMLTSTSELLALSGFGIERYRRLAPYIAALPPGTGINTCTASGLVLDTLAPGLVAWNQDPKQLQTNRQKGCFPLPNDVSASIKPLITVPAQETAIEAGLVQRTQWFRITTLVQLPTAELRLYSLLQRNPGGFSRVVLRSLGTE